MSSASDRFSGHFAARCAALTVACALLGGAASPAERKTAAPEQPARDPATLRVCSDPNNLPFSNARGQGFENRLAELVAKDLGKKHVAYKFFPQRRGFIRNTLNAGLCDLVMGVPASFDMVQATVPYYRSSYVFVTRGGTVPIKSFDDPRLRTLRIGIHVIGDDYNNVPPAEALARRGIIENIRGFPVYGPYSQPDPPRALIDAVARGDIDVAIAWGPLAGYFAKSAAVPLVITPIAAANTEGPTAMAFDISMGVRHGDEALRTSLERVLVRRRQEIHALLESYGVPLLALHSRTPAAAP
jgi:mxaJ protein